MDQAHKQFLDITAKAGEEAGHIFPSMAACEAALESGYGASLLAVRANNLFGMKAHKSTPPDQILLLPTKEYVNGQWIDTTAKWVKYPSLAACFVDRMATLRRLAPVYSHYAEGLAATSPEAFVTAVSKTWSTDPNRAAKIIIIWNSYQTELQQDGSK